jgi:hypothetical protein
LLGPGLFSFVIFFFCTAGRTPWTSDQPVTSSLPKRRINAHTDTHVLSGIRTYDLSVRTSEDNSCVRPCGQCDRLSSFEFHYLSITVPLDYTILII